MQQGLDNHVGRESLLYLYFQRICSHIPCAIVRIIRPKGGVVGRLTSSRRPGPMMNSIKIDGTSRCVGEFIRAVRRHQSHPSIYRFVQLTTQHELLESARIAMTDALRSFSRHPKHHAFIANVGNHIVRALCKAMQVIKMKYSEKYEIIFPLYSIKDELREIDSSYYIHSPDPPYNYFRRHLVRHHWYNQSWALYKANSSYTRHRSVLLSCRQ